MEVLCLYGNECAIELFTWIEEQGNKIVLWKDKLNAEIFLKHEFDLAVSYTYPFLIEEDIIQKLNGNIVNLHNSFLPFERGASPNIWNLLSKTPRGVSIHYIDSGLDTGDIIAQKIVKLEEGATLRTSYEQLDYAAKELFKDIFPIYIYWDSMRKKCLGKGTYHKQAELIPIQECFENWNYDISVQEFKDKAKVLLEELALK